MREMLGVTAAIVGRGPWRDGRVAHRWPIQRRNARVDGSVHVAPEAALGGPIAAIQEGDIINIDVTTRKLDVEISDATLQERMKSWKPYGATLRHGSLREICGAGFVGL